MTPRYSLTVALQRDRGLQEKNSSQPKAQLLSSQNNKKELSMAWRMTIILHRTNQKLPILVGILNYQFSLNSSLTATRYSNIPSPSQLIQLKKNAHNYISLACTMTGPSIKDCTMTGPSIKDLRSMQLREESTMNSTTALSKVAKYQ